MVVHVREQNAYFRNLYVCRYKLAVRSLFARINYVFGPLSLTIERISGGVGCLCGPL